MPLLEFIVCNKDALSRLPLEKLGINSSLAKFLGSLAQPDILTKVDCSSLILTELLNLDVEIGMWIFSTASGLSDYLDKLANGLNVGLSELQVFLFFSLFLFLLFDLENGMKGSLNDLLLFFFCCC